MTKDEVLRLAHEGVEIHSPNAPEYKVCAALIAALEAKDESVNDELRRLHDLLGKANALARIRAAEIESMKASLYGLYELEKQRDELEQRLTKTEAQLGEAVWNYGELKREQLANQQKTSGSPINTSTALEANNEPVAYLCENAVGHRYFRWKKPTSTYKPIPLYTAQLQRTWVGLTDEEMMTLEETTTCTKDESWLRNLTRAIEAKLKEKNT